MATKIAREILRTEARALLDCERRLSRTRSQSAAMTQAVQVIFDAIEAGGKVIVTGVGKSGLIAQKISATFASTGALSVFLHAGDGAHGDLGLIRSHDVVLVLSNSGNTDEVVRLLPLIKRFEVPVIALSGKAGSKIAKQADIWIDASVAREADHANLVPSSSSTLALALGDALALTLMKLRGFGSESFAAIHPGGGLGRRLTLRVGDLMHTGSALGVCLPTASMDQVIDLSTRKKLGAICVIDSQKSRKLVGIVTDGDIRRALKHRNRFFSLSAREIMTRTPTTISADTFASQALETMERRQSQISVLPVVDASRVLLGLIRLHDLVGTL